MMELRFNRNLRGTERKHSHVGDEGNKKRISLNKRKCGVMAIYSGRPCVGTREREREMNQRNLTGDYDIYSDTRLPQHPS